jgi:hypothetical protein
MGWVPAGGSSNPHSSTRKPPLWEIDPSGASGTPPQVIAVTDGTGGVTPPTVKATIRYRSAPAGTTWFQVVRAVRSNDTETVLGSTRTWAWTTAAVVITSAAHRPATRPRAARPWRLLGQPARAFTHIPSAPEDPTAIGVLAARL